MTDVIFIRVYDNTFYIVAEFKWSFPIYGTRQHFVLNKTNLEKRISNRKHYGMNTVEEMKALVAILEYELQNRK